MKKLTAEGHAKPPVQAEPLTQDMEEKLWERKVFGSHSGQALLYTVFFYVSKCFGLRSLTDGSFVFGEDAEGQYVVGVEFVGGKSKNYQRDLAQQNVKAKRRRHYSSPLCLFFS